MQSSREHRSEGGGGDDLGHQLEALKQSTLMLVDDEPTTLDVLQVLLEGEGYRNFVTTTDPARALDLIESERPDVLLLDLMMPGVSGLDILDAVRRDASLEFLPVIILTSSTDSETKLKALELGATDFLGKPVDPSELVLRLRNTLAAKAYQDRLAYYDRLTGLPNRRLFLERTERALRRAGARSQRCALLHANLDRFKTINDTLGHGVGDALLRAVADRLEKCALAGDLRETPEAADERPTLSRLSGDEFTLLLPGTGSVESAARVARRILSSLAEPFCVDGRDLFVSSSIGIAFFPADGDGVETLLGCADVATSHAKRSGGNDYQLYSRSLDTQSLEQLNLEHHLRKALERDELRLHYQPQLCVRTGHIVGAEALLRWEHPEFGMVPPARFVRIAEEAGLIGSLGEWALWVACRQHRALQERVAAPLRIAVNVSGKQFRKGWNLVTKVHDALSEAGLAPERLVIELTESMIMEDPVETSRILRELKDMGVRLSVDDFGTGYSSLASLKRFPLDELKIDRSFVKNVPRDADGAAIVTAIIAMAHSLGLEVVAEGVETEEQLAFLRDRGCDEYQGYLFSQPVPAEEWAQLIARSGRRA